MPEAGNERVYGEEALRLGRIVARYQEDAEGGFAAILNDVARRVAADYGLLAVRLAETEELQVVAVLGEEETRQGALFGVGEGWLGRAMERDTALTSEDGLTLWPVHEGDQRVGVLGLGRSSGGPFTATEHSAVELLLPLVGVALVSLVSQARRVRQLGQVETLVAAQQGLHREMGPQGSSGKGSGTLDASVAGWAAKLLQVRGAMVVAYGTDGEVVAWSTAPGDDGSGALMTVAGARELATKPFREGVGVRYQDVSQVAGIASHVAEGLPFRRLLAQPVWQQGRIAQAIVVVDRQDDQPFTETDAAYLGSLAVQVGDLLERQALLTALDRRADDLQRQLQAAVTLTAKLQALRSPELDAHAREVADLVVALGKQEGLADQDLEHLRMAALLHDLGKLGMNDTILRKPYSLLHSGDRKRIREHPVLGEAALMALQSMDPVAEMIRHHHELLDGSGYPDGLTSEHLPRGTRILTVANMYSSLRRGGIFVRGLSPDDALSFLWERAGAQYDAGVVRRLADHLDRTRIVMGEEGDAEAVSEGTDEALATVWPTRTLPSSLIKPGMQLAKDLETDEGMLLLSKDFVLDEALIRKIRYFETRLGRSFRVTVYKSSPDESGDGQE